jgi:hypothetical protein
VTASAALCAVPSSETFGLPPCDTHLIAKLRCMDPALLATIRPTHLPTDKEHA